MLTLRGVEPTRTTKVFTERVLVPLSPLVSRFWCLCVWLFVLCGVMGRLVFGESTSNTHLMSDWALLMHLSSPFWSRQHSKRGSSAAFGCAVMVSRLWLPGTRALAHVSSNVVSAQEHGAALQQVRRPQRLLPGSWPWTLSLGLYSVDMATHILGVPNRLPDDLSRMWALQPHLLPRPL